MNQIINHKNKYYLKTKNGYKEILSSTDTSLNLPKPSQQFIIKYIESYNKGEVITDVLVGYEDIIYNPEKDREYQSNDRINIEDCDKQTRLKINPKDNTITIKIIKDCWSRKELQPLKDYYEHSKLFARSNDYREQDVQRIFNWIEENL